MSWISSPITAAGPSLILTGFPIKPHLAPETDFFYIGVKKESQYQKTAKGFGKNVDVQ